MRRIGKSILELPPWLLWILIPGLLAFFLAGSGAHSAELSFTASIDRNELSMDEQLILTISVSGKDVSGIGEPELPELDGFEVVGRNSSSSSRVSFVNGKMSSSHTLDYMYYLRPLRTGTLTIGEATIRFGGKTYKTEPIQIEVSKSAGGRRAVSPPPVPRAPEPRRGRGRDIFIEARVDKRKAVVGEQITLTYVLYSRARVTGLRYASVPPYTGFWAEQLFEAKRLNPERKVIGGLAYDAFVLKKVALFPTMAGELKLDPLEAVCEVAVRSDDFFGFFDRSRDYPVKSNPVEVSVENLPAAGRPPVFAGAVGRFRISGTVDNDSPRLGEGVTLTLRVSGRGNMKTLPNPSLPEVAGIRKYEPEISLSLDKTGGVVGGEKVFKYVLVPEVVGSVTIPSVSLSYFDPEKKAYETARTKPIRLNVKPGTVRPPVTAVGTRQSEVKRMGEDIRFIKSDVEDLDSYSVSFYRSVPFLSLQFVPVIGLVLSAYLKRRSDRLKRDPAWARFLNATRNATREIRKAESCLRSDDPVGFSAALSKALARFLYERLGIPSARITAEEVAEAMRDKGVEEETIGRYRDCVSRLDYLRFAPASETTGEMKELIEAARLIVRELRKSKVERG